ncbi:MAG: methyltransferase domain-containing protein [Henriciella sp.]
MNSAQPPKLFDRDQLARNRDTASADYRKFGFLKARASEHLIERLQDVSRQFPRALDLGAHTGATSLALRESPQIDSVISLERSSAMARDISALGLGAVCADEDALPFAPTSFDLITSTLALHWVNDLPGALLQIRDTLKPDGLFLGCLFGGGTLAELRAALIEAESELTGGISPRLSPLPSLQDMAGLLQRAGFALPVADVERVTVRYSSPMGLLKDLKGMGEQAAFAQRDGQERRPLSRRLLARMIEIYHDRFSDPDGKVRASFEIVWLSGWTPAAGQPQPKRRGSARASMADAVRGASKK